MMIDTVNLQELYFYLFLFLLILFFFLLGAVIIFTIIKRVKNKNSIARNTDYFSRLAHDLKSPLTTIDGYTYLSKQNLTDVEKTMGFLDKIEQSSKYMQALINETIEISQLKNKKLELNKTRINLNDVIENCINMVELGLKQKQIHFENTIDICHTWVMADGVCLSQVISNLLTNSMKYTPDHGNVWFKVVEERKSLGFSTYHFIIKDNGCGMSKDFQKKLFEPFAQEKKVDCNLPSSGLGLYIVRQLIDLMHGDIKVESKEDEGSCFTIKLDFYYLEND